MSGRIEYASAIVIVVADVLRVAVVVVALISKGVFLLLILLSRFSFTAHEIHFLDATSHLYKTHFF